MLDFVRFCTVFKGVESDVLRMCSDVCCTGSSGLPVLPTSSSAFMEDKKY